MIKGWLRKCLGIYADFDNHLKLLEDHGAAVTYDFNNLQDQINKLIWSTGAQQDQIKELRAEVTRLSIAQYVPPKQPEPERKIIKTRNFKEYLDILEQEQSREHSDAV